MSDAATLSILLDIRARLDALEAAKKGIREIKTEAANTTSAVRSGFGNMFSSFFGAGMAVNATSRAISMALGMVGSAFREANDAVETAKNLGVSFDGYSKLGKIAEANGGSITAMATAIDRMNQSLSVARELGADGSKSEAGVAFDYLGLNSIELEAVGVEQRFLALAQAAKASKDQNQAWRAVGDIIGDKTLRQLRGGLEELAENGFGSVADAATEAETRGAQAINSLYDNLQRNASLFKSKIVEDFGSLLDGIGFRPTSTSAAAEAPTVDVSKLQSLRDQQEAFAKMRLQLKVMGIQNEVLVNDPTFTDSAKKMWINDATVKVTALIRMMHELRKVMPLAKGETEDARAAELATYQAQVRGAEQGLKSGPSAYTRISERFDNIETRPSAQVSGNSDHLTGAQGFDAGAMEWATSLGSQGEQIASAMQSTIGASVSSISQGIYGWITGTQSFGDVLASLGSTVLQTLIQTIVQMGVQWVITGGMAKASMAGISLLGSALRKKEVGETIAAETAKKPAIMSNAAGASAGSFGLSAVIGIALLLALMAAFGGFADGGYTGHGGKYDVAGVVHRGEDVWSQADIARAGGVDAVEAMRMSGGQNMIEGSPVRTAPVTGSPVSAPVAVGGLIAGALAAAGMAGGRRESPRNTYLLMDRSEFSRMMQEDSSGWFQDMSAQWARKNA